MDRHESLGLIKVMLSKADKMVKYFEVMHNALEEYSKEAYRDARFALITELKEFDAVLRLTSEGWELPTV